VYREASLYQVKESEYAYKLHFDGKMGALSALSALSENERQFLMEIVIEVSRLVWPDPRPSTSGTAHRFLLHRSAV